MYNDAPPGGTFYEQILFLCAYKPHPEEAACQTSEDLECQFMFKIHKL